MLKYGKVKIIDKIKIIAKNKINKNIKKYKQNKNKRRNRNYKKKQNKNKNNNKYKKIKLDNNDKNNNIEKNVNIDKHDLLEKLSKEIIPLSNQSHNTHNTHYHKDIIPKRIRELVWTTHNGKVFSHDCYVTWCHNKINVFNFQVGHDIPESKGGTLDIDNLKPICSNCNHSMGNKYTIKEWNKLVIEKEKEDK